MYLVEVFFTYRQPQKLPISNISYLINQIIEQWRYNGQIIGREIPLFVAVQNNEEGFALRVTCPEQQSLLPTFNNIQVDKALEQAKSAGIFLIVFKSLRMI